MWLKDIIEIRKQALLSTEKRDGLLFFSGPLGEQSFPDKAIKELGHCVLEKACSRSDFLLGRRLCAAADGDRSLFRQGEICKAVELAS